MILNRTSLLTLLLSFLLMGTSYAQYLPDTSLTYTRFLKQCQEFSRQEQSEAWVVNFWASYNTPSLTLLPKVQEVMENFSNKPVRLISISIDKNRSYWEQRLKYYELSGEHLLLADGDNYEFLRKAFKHGNLPALFVVYPNGDILRVADAPELRSELNALAPRLPNLPNGPADPRPDPSIVQGGTTPNPANPSGGNTQSTGGSSNVDFIIHTVRSGDTLYGLQRKYGVPVADIKRYNNMTSNTIKRGQVIKIPQGG